MVNKVERNDLITTTNKKSWLRHFKSLFIIAIAFSLLKTNQLVNLYQRKLLKNYKIILCTAKTNSW